MTDKQPLITMMNIETKILLIRGQKVMLDADLAELYGVETKRLNEQMRRNIERFPEDFMFRLTAEEKAEVVANCDHLAQLKYSPTLPYAFTEHGALMLGNVLKSARAIEVSLMVVRTFVQLRQMLSTNAELSRKLVAMEKNYDIKFKAIFEAIHQLMTPADPKKKRPIGFAPWDKK
ncbi:MAG: ORF6N domain-containing protein [Sideroxydans sp.]|nr:ORF6N domain-containing protein [Sideroxydans sp.]